MRAGLRPAALPALLTVVALSGCATRPPNRLVVSRVAVTGGGDVDPAEVEAKLATQANATLFGFVLEYEVYDRFVVDRDIQRIERIYRAKGYYEARVRAARVTTESGGKVKIDFVVDEGPPTRVSAVRIEVRGDITADARYALARAETLKPGSLLDEDALAKLRSGIQKALNDNGYAYATIEGGFVEADLAPDGGNVKVLDPIRDLEKVQKAEADAAAVRASTEGAAPRRFSVRVDEVAKTAEIYLRVDPGPACVFGDVDIDGAANLPEGQLRAAIGIHRGERFSTAELESARHALLEMGLFSSVEFVTTGSREAGPEVPVTFRLAVSPLHTVTLGGGFQADVLRTDAHFVAGYEHQNWLGGLRRLTLNAKPGIVFFPTNLQNFAAPERLLPEFRGHGEIRQPQFLERRANGTVRWDFLVYPFILPAPTKAAIPNVVVGYVEPHAGVGIDRSFFAGKLKLSTFYNVQVSYPFAYVGPPIDASSGIQRVVISYVDFTQALDLRDDAIQPHKGFYLANDVQVAGGFSDARDVRVQPDARGYLPLSNRVTLAARTSFGFLFPSSYGGTLNESPPDPTTDPAGAVLFDRHRNRDLQLLFFRAFFSGGPSSNRGYPLRGVGPRGIAPFAIGGGTRAISGCIGRTLGGAGVPATASQIAAIPAVDPSLCGVPLGGLSLWESSLEVRFELSDKLSTLLFVDASDVTRQRFTVRLAYPHLSTGTGIRYETPVGPVRLDVGYAIPSLQHIGGQLDPNAEGTPQSIFNTIPIAVSIAVGEAF